MNARVLYVTEGLLVNGPGRRTTVHFAGCSIRCKGCFSPHSWSKTAGQDYPVEELFRAVWNSGDPGVAISGGEPTEQSDALRAFLVLLYAAEFPGGIVMFSGVDPELFAPGGVHHWCREYVDLIVAGPYDVTQPCKIGLRSSFNQRLLYGGRGSILPEQVEQVALSFQLKIGMDGVQTIAGFPSKEVLDVSSGKGKVQSRQRHCTTD